LYRVDSKNKERKKKKESKEKTKEKKVSLMLCQKESLDICL